MAAVTDFRIEVGFFSHIKTRRLERRLTGDGVTALLRLWEYAAQNAPTGNLATCEAEEVELAAYWTGEDGALVDALLEIGFLDQEDGEYVLHDWAEHQPWVVNAPGRSEKARHAANARHNRKDAARNAQPKADSATSMPVACGKHANSNAPSPSPSPSPSPIPSPPEPERAREAEIPADTPDKAPPEPPPALRTDRTAEEHHALVAFQRGDRKLVRSGKAYPHTEAMLEVWRQHAPANQQPTEAQARQACRYVCLPELYPLDEWAEVCKLVGRSPFLRGDDGKFRASFGWLIEPQPWSNARAGKYLAEPEKAPAGPARRNFSAELAADDQGDESDSRESLITFRAGHLALKSGQKGADYRDFMGEAEAQLIAEGRVREVAA